MVVTGIDRLLRPAQPQATDTPTDGAAADGPLLLRLGDWHVFGRPVDYGGPTRRVVASFVGPDGQDFPVLEDESGALHPPFSIDEAYGNYLGELWAAATDARRVSSRQLAAFYRLKRFIPRGAQLAARRAFVRWQGTPTFPAWPLDDGVDRLLGLHAACLASRDGARGEHTFGWFWPDGNGAALILSHDVETDEGVRLAVELADLEESLGFRSAFNFGAWYDVDPGVLHELTSRGFEVGMHGLVHDRSLFASRAAFERALPELRALAGRLGAVGFRSPATHRVVPWLSELPVEYDGTIPHSDPYEPQPGGCCSIWPFFVGDVVELPYTVPQDHTLLTLLRHRDATLWIDAAASIERRHGLIHAVSHPDPGYLGDADKRAIYAEFLTAMTERGRVWHALPAEAARWWRGRDAGDDPRLVEGSYVRDGGSPIDVRLVPPTG